MDERPAASTPPQALGLEALRRSPRPHLLFVSHAYEGGVARHIAELAASLEGRAEVSLLRPHRSGLLELRVAGAGDGGSLWLDPPQDWGRMIELLRALGVDRVHFHHVDGLPERVLDLPRELGCDHDVTLHDFYPACSAYHFSGPGRFCGARPECRRCDELRAPQWPLTVDAWRARFRPWLAAASRVIVPSHDAAGHLRDFFPDVAPRVWPHAEAPAASGAAPRRVLVPGAISREKGVDLLEACVRDAAQRGLPLHFRVIGLVARPLPSWPEAPLTLTGEYREHELPALLAQERGDALLFLSQVPETYSYTLSAALGTGLPIVATDLGALPERLAGRANARIVRWDATAAEVNDALLAVAPSPAPRSAEWPRVTPDAYRERYLEGLARAAPPEALLPPIEARWQQPPAEDPPETTLAWLYEDGILCGRRRSRERLLPSAIEVQERLNDAMVRLGDAWKLIHEKERERQETERERDRANERANVAEHERELQRGRAERAEYRVADMERSHSWRLTAPLRALMRLVRR